MNSRNRMKLALEHKEADQVPFDFGSTLVTGITDIAYKNLIESLGYKDREIAVAEIAYATADPHEDILRELHVDVLGIYPGGYAKKNIVPTVNNGRLGFTDAWGISWEKPDSGFFYDMVKHPLADVPYEEIGSFEFPDHLDSQRIGNIIGKAKKVREADDKYVILGSCIYAPGLFQLCQFLLSFEEAFVKLAIEEKYIQSLLDKVVEREIECWKNLLTQGGDFFDVVIYTDDFGSQNSLTISQKMIRKFFVPHYKNIFKEIKKLSPHIKILFHSCGAIYDIIPDLIEMGIDILNPIQVSCNNMDIMKIKKNFGKDIVLWGGGVDTQRILPYGTIQEVTDAVKKSIDIMAPGGGFVFNPVHSIQPEVPPQNLVAMFEAVERFGKY